MKCERMYCLMAMLTFMAISWTGCGGGSSSTAGTTAPSTSAPSITVEAFSSGGAIPAKYTCDGADISPPVKISGVSSSAKSLVLIVDDPDAPGGTWNHWVLFDIPQATTDIAENSLPAGAISGSNDFGRSQYNGPCPPAGGAHRYYFRLYALNTATLGLFEGANRAQVDAAMAGAILEGYPVEYMGTYQR